MPAVHPAWLRAGLAGLVLACAALLPARADARRAPHIGVVVADDLGWGDVGFHGGIIPTPQIDALANGGVRLEAFYVQPACTPTRAALLTGRYPMRQGLQQGVVEPWTDWGLPLDERTLAAALRDAGYRTALASYHGALDDQFTRTRMGGLDWHRDGEPARSRPRAGSRARVGDRIPALPPGRRHGGPHGRRDRQDRFVTMGRP